jgi:selenophosphate synthase
LQYLKIIKIDKFILWSDDERNKHINLVQFSHDIKDKLFKIQKNLLTDPQTSGGLLVACSAEVEQEVLDLFIQDGFTQAKKVGIFEPGSGVAVL